MRAGERYAESRMTTQLQFQRPITQDELLSDYVRGWSADQLRRKIRLGEFPPGIRLSPRKRIWDIETIRSWLADRAADGGGHG
jgi:hypothetical protein